MGSKYLRGFTLEQSAGTATGLDVAQQETAVALLYAAIPPLEQQFRQTVNALAVLLGRTPESIDVDSGTLSDLTSPAVIAGIALRSCWRAAPTSRQPKQQLIGANADITVARAALFPSIELTASGGYESTALVLARQSRQPHLRRLRRLDPADFSRRRAARSARLQQGALYRIAERATTRRF